MPRRLLLISDDRELREGISRWLLPRGYLLAEIDESVAHDALIVDLVDAARRNWPRLSRSVDGAAVVALCPAGGIELGVAALKEGADDFLLRPFDVEELEIKLERACQGRALRTAAALPPPPPERSGDRELTGSSSAIRAVRERIARAAASSATVLLTGETGTGKERAASLLHRCSDRRHRPMVRINCAALPEPLLESELFGHERGAFTGAEQRRRGRFEEAHGGTLFLDEIGDMHPPIQAKVLRALQEREFQRLGGSELVRVDVRVIAATNQDLSRSIREGGFREDLYYRLNVVPIQLPPLRERAEDIVELAGEILLELGADASPVQLSARARAALVAHPWPGNIRELHNVLERAVLMRAGACIEIGDLDLGDTPPRATVPSGSGAAVQLPPEGIDHREVERLLIVQALERCNWVQKDAAHLLRMTRRKLNYRIRRLGITHPSWRINRSAETSFPGGSALS